MKRIWQPKPYTDEFDDSVRWGYQCAIDDGETVGAALQMVADYFDVSVEYVREALQRP